MGGGGRPRDSSHMMFLNDVLKPSHGLYALPEGLGRMLLGRVGASFRRGERFRKIVIG